jgi:hypothetical protein
VHDHWTEQEGEFPVYAFSLLVAMNNGFKHDGISVVVIYNRFII